MVTAEIIQSGDSQSVRLPNEFHFAAKQVSIRREGDAVILEPIRQASWPPGFFEAIRIDDAAFVRPPQAPDSEDAITGLRLAIPPRYQHVHRGDDPNVVKRMASFSG